MHKMAESPMVDPATAPWGLTISDTDFEKLKAGFQPADMDDRWAISAADSDDGRTTTITLCRSWTGRKHYILAVKPGDSGSGAKIKGITWEQNKGGIYISEEQSKKEVVLLCRGLLKCDFDELPHYDASLVWNHPDSRLGTDYLAKKNSYLSSTGRESSGCK